jgi:hypothetical protein
MPALARYIGIDYSGTKTLTSGFNRLRVYWSDALALPAARELEAAE